MSKVPRKSYWRNSNRVAIDGTYKPVEECKAGIEKQLLDYQNQAMRTLGFAYQILEDGQDATFFVNGRLHKTDLTYLGIVAISDPVVLMFRLLSKVALMPASTSRS